MPRWFEHVAARLARWHADRVYARFRAALRRVRAEQQTALDRTLALVAQSDFGRRHALARVRSPDDLRRAVPVATYEDLRPYIDRVWHGETEALFPRAHPILMFATTSGTTAQPKLVPVTPEFVRDYRRGWNTFGLKMLTDHPAAVLRAILQSSSRYDSRFSPKGVPCGAITGLLAKMQKRIVRRYYVGRPELTHLSDARARYYTLMRLGIGRDVAFAITANPATLLQMARTASEESETLIRDVRDGTLSADMVADPLLRRTLSTGLRPRPLERASSNLAPARHARAKDYWNLTFLACWTGGSMSGHLGRLREWYGDLPIRDIGLLASEGRISIPLEDGTAAGVLDVQSALFEFIPIEDVDKPQPATRWAWELETGRDYVTVLTNASGLVRYRLDDVVRTRGWVDQAPLIEFLYRAGRISSVTGEKLTENQAVEAVRAACERLNTPTFDFALAPCWADPPYYRLTLEVSPVAGLAKAVDAALCQQNDEYESRRKSSRLGEIQLREVAPGTIQALERRLLAQGSTAEQLKRPCLFTQPGDDDRALGT